MLLCNIIFECRVSVEMAYQYTTYLLSMDVGNSTIRNIETKTLSLNFL